MSALTTERDTTELANGGRCMVLPVKAGTTIYQGAIVALDADGYAVPGKTATGLTAAGRAEETVSAGNADATIVVTRGTFVFENTATAANKIKAANVLKPCYIEDDQTVTILATGASAAGTVIRVDSTGIAVEIGFAVSGTGA